MKKIIRNTFIALVAVIGISSIVDFSYAEINRYQYTLDSSAETHQFLSGKIKKQHIKYSHHG